MNWRQFSRDYLRFSRQDRIGSLTILIVIASCFFIPFLFSRRAGVSIKKDAVLVAAMDSLYEKQKNNNEVTGGNEIDYQPTPTIRNNFSKAELFDFDPNILDSEGWKKLGLPERSIKTISNYRAKGGKFYNPEDLKKIWGLPEGFYDYVKGHIKINRQSSQAVIAPRKIEKNKSWNININTADTSALIALPGIGSKLALRILNFREKLGGFYSVEQIGETYGLVDSTFQKIKPYLFISGEVEKFNINSATKDILKNHPYIKWNLANAIVEYRNQHGNFKQLDDLKNITILDETTYRRIANYLSL